MNREWTAIHGGEPTPGDNGGWREDSGLKQLSDYASVSSCGSIKPDRLPADAPNPYLTVGPGRREAGRDCDTNGGIAVLHN